MHDNMIVESVLKGNLVDYEKIVDKYQKPIYNLAYRMSRDKDDSEDITQNVFIKAYENLAKFDPKQKFFSWIYRIALNETLNYVKKQKSNTELDETSFSTDRTPEIIHEENETSVKIQNALMKLDINYRLVVVLKHFQNYSYEEISALLDVETKTVKSRLYSARQILKDLLRN